MNVESQITTLKEHNLTLVHYRLFFHFCSFIVSLFRNKKAIILLNKFAPHNKTYIMRSRYSIPSFSLDLKRFSFTTIASKLLNSFICIKIIDMNYSLDYLKKYNIDLFDKYYHYFYASHPLA